LVISRPPRSLVTVTGNGAAAVFGGADVLYNNASALRNGPLMELSDEDSHFTIKNEILASQRSAGTSQLPSGIGR
jgi:NAD(P)-dependent dehydrogenase (short-subunit alcohol dehydrogenase family)